MTEEKIVSELEIILSELQLLNIRLGNVVEFLRMQLNPEQKKEGEENG